MSTTTYPKIVLHIDDDEDDHFLIRDAITNIDPDIILRTASDGKEAIDFLNQAKFLGDLPSLIILDVNMPVMNGIETYHEIRKDAILSSIPIAVFTTSLNNTDLAYWEKENIPAFTKPTNFKGITDCVMKMISHYPSSSSDKSS